jgi:hypothetical protein
MGIREKIEYGRGMSRADTEIKRLNRENKLLKQQNNLYRGRLLCLNKEIHLLKRKLMIEPYKPKTFKEPTEEDLMKI